MIKKIRILFIILFTIIINNFVNAGEINIYSHRQPFLINPFLEFFTAETGITTNIIYSKKGLAERLQAEGENTPADVVLTVDIGRLYVYQDKDLLASIQSNILEENIPIHLRSSDNTWFGLSKRARVVIIAKDRVGLDEIKRIEDLADPKWNGRICSRPGSHVYNRALMASIIAAHGEIKAEKWVNGLVKNFARRPQGNDRAQVKAIYEGQCDIAIINNYYFGKLKFSEDPKQREWTKNLKLIFPNQDDDDRGSHVNISGGGVVKFSKNKEDAIALLEFLTSKKAQELYGEINFEYPVNPNITASQELQGWGTLREDQLPIIKIAELAPLAQKIIDRSGW